jgi:hypothetical protein
VSAWAQLFRMLLGLQLGCGFMMRSSNVHSVTVSGAGSLFSTAHRIVSQCVAMVFARHLLRWVDSLHKPSLGLPVVELRGNTSLTNLNLPLHRMHPVVQMIALPCVATATVMWHVARWVVPFPIPTIWPCILLQAVCGIL